MRSRKQDNGSKYNCTNAEIFRNCTLSGSYQNFKKTEGNIIAATFAPVAFNSEKNACSSLQTFTYAIAVISVSGTMFYYHFKNCFPYLICKTFTVCCPWTDLNSSCIAQQTLSESSLKAIEVKSLSSSLYGGFVMLIVHRHNRYISLKKYTQVLN